MLNIQFQQVEAITTPIKSPDNVIDFGADFTPKVSTVVLNQIVSRVIEYYVASTEFSKLNQ